MPRQPTLRKKQVGKQTYWYTEAGQPTYFGSVNDVAFVDAKKLFSSHLQSLSDGAVTRKVRGLTAGELMDLFLDWVRKNRSTDSYESRRTACSRFGAFLVGKKHIRDLHANQVTSDDLTAFLMHLEKEEGLSPQTRRHYETSVKHCWNWATKHPSPIPVLSPSYRPFAAVERTRVPAKRLTEDELLTDKEIETLFSAARLDLDEFHRFRSPKTPEENRYGNFSEMLQCYYHTGARTGELAACLVEDVLFRTGQVVLGKHKRSQTQREPTLRHITLNDTALEIFQRLCQGKSKTDSVFTNSEGRQWTGSLLPKRFDRIKNIASKKQIGQVRDEITIYAFRHLWISEMLMEGNDIATVAKMAGTSISMIERVYGHFRNQHLRDAQDRLDKARKQRKLK